MELFRESRLRHGRYLLRKRADTVTRKRFRGNLKNARSIGIVWDASDISGFPVLSQFQQKMQDRNIETRILAYYPEKVLPDRLTAIRYLSCIRRDDLNFFYIPVSGESESFIKTSFDVLIEINFSNSFPVEYITTLSRAGIKTGLYDEKRNNNPYDLMIDASKPVRLDEYLENVIQYLELINTNAEN